MTASQISDASWMLEGEYFEGCNCDVACPCIFFSDPTEGNCHVTCAWHIQYGNYGNIDLNNLNVVAMFNSHSNMFTGPKWKAALYVGERANQQQKDLILKYILDKPRIFCSGTCPYKISSYRIWCRWKTKAD